MPLDSVAAPALLTSMKTYRWVDRPLPETADIEGLRQALNDLPEALARALVLRGIETYEQARRYFRASFDDTHDPFLMRDMEAAADRLARAIEQQERVLVYGDYDVDGTTSTALLTRFLRQQGAEADFFIPNRFTHGYGLNNAGIDYAREQGASLLVALDCGITALDEAVYAGEQGIDLIICDHHTAGETAPDALAVLDPKRPGCAYPYKELSGCGVTFKLVQATLQRLGKPAEAAHLFLDLVAVSTASDIVPLTGENRILMREGLKQLQAQPRPGLRALAEAARLDFGSVSVERLVFGIGPRINAAGRMGEAGRAVALLLSEDHAEARDLAAVLESANQHRRALDREMQHQALRKAERQLSARRRNVLVLHDPEWHQGIVGIVASRVVDRFQRPAVMLCSVNGVAKGSARSIPGINIYDALKECEDLLIQFGGHDHAAGLTLAEENIDALRERLDEAVGAHMQPEMMLPTLEIDARLEIGDVDRRFWSVLQQFAPFGPGNMKPIFQTEGIEVVGRPRTVGAHDAHLKFDVRPAGASGSRPFPVIAFGMGEHRPALEAAQRDGRRLDLAFCVDENTWQGRTTLQLKAKDLRVERA